MTMAGGGLFGFPLFEGKLGELRVIDFFVDVYLP